MVARQLGAYLGLPLLKRGFLPALSPADIDPLTCRPREADIFGTIGARAQAELLPKLRDLQGHVDISKLRVDPSLDATNLAIGGFRVQETVAGAGGLLSLDSMHFSDTGYAVLANIFIEEVNAALGTKVPLADLAAINATDAYSVEGLQAVGISCAGTPN